jgi:hypothetical protein
MGRGEAAGGRGGGRARRAAATAFVAATGFGFGLAALGVVAAAFAVGEIRSRAPGAGSSRSKRPPLGEREWRAAADRDGRVGDRLDAVLRRVASGGVDPALRAEVWPLLLGLREPWHTAVEQEQRRRARRDAYRALRARCDELERLLAGKGATAAAAAPRAAANKTPGKPPPPGTFPDPPEDLGTHTEAAPVIRADVPRTAFQRGPFAAHWRAERAAESDLDLDDQSNKAQTLSANRPTWQSAQAKRLAAVLSAYALHDPEVGYCQGMNEVAACFLDNVPDESEAFWCFAAFLDGFRSHFIISPSPSRPDAPGPGPGPGPGSGSGSNRRARARGGTVRDKLAGLGDIFRRCDPPMWKHVQLLGAQECMFAFRAVVVLLARELPPDETAFLWEALMAAGDHLEADAETGTGTERASDESGGDAGGSRTNAEPTGGSKAASKAASNASGRREEGAGDGRLFLHCVAAAFIQARHVVFGCREFDDLLHASHHAVAAKCVAAAPLLASARRLATQPWRTAHCA